MCACEDSDRPTLSSYFVLNHIYWAETPKIETLTKQIHVAENQNNDTILCPLQEF